MSTPRRSAGHLERRDGFALLLVLFILLAVGLIAMAAATLIGSSQMLADLDRRQTQMEAAADAGLEEGRARINGDPALYPDSGYSTLENAAVVRDAAGAVVPGITRTTYVARTGVATGQFGVFGTLLVVVRDAGGRQVVRRVDVSQESFAKFAYFTDDENGIVFGGGDQIQGPVHSNDNITIHSTGATFRGPGTVTTVGTVSGAGNGHFYEGYTQGAPRIPMPTTADLNRLRGYATQGGTAFTAPTGGNAGEVRMRIEFVAIDLNGDGRVTGADEGFFKVYTSNNAAWLMAQKPGTAQGQSGASTLTSSNYCGAYTGGRFWSASDWSPGHTAASTVALLQSSTRRCLLGGSDSLHADGRFQPSDGPGGSLGEWMPRPWTWASMPDSIAVRPDRDYLFPLSHAYNPNFKGVIHVTGRVGVSGVLRGRVTLAATGDIHVVDDLQYANQPGVGRCPEIDMLGLFSGGNLTVSDNTVNSPAQVQGNTGTYYDFDDTDNVVTLHGVLLTLNSFTAQNYTTGPTASETCNGVTWGRGCLAMAGGVIQATRGAVGQSDGHGYLKSYSYDACARVTPPPYFPTTGRFARSRYYEINPVGFNAAAYLDQITAG